MGRHKATAEPVIAMVDGRRIRWQPAAEYNSPGVFTGPGSVLERINEAIERKSQTAMRGILVVSDNKTAPGVMAAMEIASVKQIRYVQIPDEVNDWFAQNRTSTTRVSAEDMAPPPESGFGARVNGLLRRRLI